MLTKIKNPNSTTKGKKGKFLLISDKLIVIFHMTNVHKLPFQGRNTAPLKSSDFPPPDCQNNASKNFA